MRHLLPFAAACTSFALLAACGGGGASMGSTGALVVGKVVQQGASSAGVASVRATCENTGLSALTGTDGTFSFEVPSGERIVVRLQGGGGPAAGRGPDCREGDDTTSDGLDTDETGVELEPLERGEVVEVEIELRDGTVVECWIGREGAGGGRGEGECPLLPDPTLPPEARGELEATRDGDCLALELEVEGLANAGTLEARLVAAGGEAVLGTVEVGPDGAGHLSAVVCLDDLALPALPELPPLPEDLLPPGAALPRELDGFFGAAVLLVDASGRVLFAGFVPGPGLEPGEGWEEGVPPHEPPPFPGDLGDIFELTGLPPDLADLLQGVFGALLPR